MEELDINLPSETFPLGSLGQATDNTEILILYRIVDKIDPRWLPVLGSIFVWILLPSISFTFILFSKSWISSRISWEIGKMRRNVLSPERIKLNKHTAVLSQKNLRKWWHGEGKFKVGILATSSGAEGETAVWSVLLVAGTTVQGCAHVLFIVSHSCK